ncbi:hypothetical protein N656DRAFT_588317 [Canariomyces notabilis]|jgi:plasminogen activator inhibitor 1 RNA-binding protein|uniref:Hyaluronan/mRNA-binding protein domain-containing protein n=1 Tax=Canariomyces notabilis TaxID=2074819 RepID=A0AAN6TH83_9PEZI|nr:hypothetical protein N656DRAFT_588317 [Canariomyces arenarius]
MSAVATKNPYDALGNDVEDDTPAPVLKPPVEKTSTHTAKRNTDGLAPSKGPVPTSGRRGGGVSGNEAAFRDRNAGRDSNRGKPTDEAPRGGRRGGYRGRGGRQEGERHPTKTAPHANSDKQAAVAWGAQEGNAELKDEQAGEAIAQSEQKAAAEGEAAPEGEAQEEEPEDKHISYEQYLAQLAEKKLALEAEAALKVRKPNEGVKDDKWKDLKPLSKKDEEEELFAGTGGKAKRERERKTKQFLEIENRYIEPERTRGGRGGRGGARGDGAGRGRGRGGAPRGEFRGGAPRGEFRGGRGRGGQAPQATLNPQDQDAFPSLGGK